MKCIQRLPSSGNLSISILLAGLPGHHGLLVQNHVAILSNIEHEFVRFMIQQKSVREGVSQTNFGAIKGYFHDL